MSAYLEPLLRQALILLASYAFFGLSGLGWACVGLLVVQTLP
jgi:hypothetical protein